MFDVLLVDGRHLLWRSADVFRDLWVVTDTGERLSTGAVYGFLNVITRVKQQHVRDAGAVVVCWEGGNLKRRRMFDGYKHRKDNLVPLDRLALIESIARQQTVLQKLLSALGVPQAHAPGWEADDAMGALADRWSKFSKVAVYTGDRDLYQCVSERVTILRPLKMGEVELVTPEVLLSRYGVTSRGYLYAKALAGDTGDGIPGVRGVGEKTALKVVCEASKSGPLSLSALAEHGPKVVSKRVAATLAASHESGELKLWFELSRIRCNVKLHFTSVERLPRKQLTHLLMGLRFRSLLEPGRFRQLLALGCSG